jgi:hypothetical protein
MHSIEKFLFSRYHNPDPGLGQVSSTDKYLVNGEFLLGWRKAFLLET